MGELIEEEQLTLSFKASLDMVLKDSTTRVASFIFLELQVIYSFFKLSSCFNTKNYSDICTFTICL